MAFDEDQESTVISYPTFSELHGILSRHFEITMSLMEYGMPTFLARWVGGIVPDTKEQDAVFKEIAELTEPLKVWPIVRWHNESEGEYIIRFVPIQKSGASNVRINQALFIATLATIAIAGFLQATSPIFLTLFYPSGYSLWDILFVTGTFMLALMGIIFTHEMGHYKMSKKKGIDVSLPYFIPGLPQLGGTFGAFISQKSPSKNREDLLDVGLAGPLAGFVVTVVVLFIGFLMSVPVTHEELIAIERTFPNQSGSLGVPYLFTLVEMMFSGFVPAGGTLYLHPIGFAAWVGMLITSLNLFPVAQLDGGHALRAVVGPKWHKYIGYIAIIVMFLMQYWTMAILVLLLSSGGGGHPGPLNDTVKVSRWRVALFIISMLILVLCIPPIWTMT
ncbi:MAG: hypothetical protein DRO87_08350 [Candidatus Thorarchaeota archaeon]|nr:MAG: hypothetical protein DRO87_08350 [Candidatus Thorarchaeota archaeon]RLI58191.1 MAG: hypothetical protein DRP09_00180 [Candidatus Thorarchaeota archaeon]